ncbi:MAG: hydroxymyristoyl-ACP dehydratase [Lysobacterales bacterium]
MTAATRWVVPPEHPALAGHFPGHPVLPGVVLLDAVLELIARESGVALDQCEVTSVKFLSPAKPGDELLIRHETSAGGGIRFDITAGGTAADRRIAQGNITPGSITPGGPA